MIKRVSLKNWKSHLDSEFTFSKGVNALIGIMGSGKSSVMEAVSFALYGTFPALNSKKITLNDLIMKRPQKKSRAEVFLEFVMDGKNYSVRRTIETEKGTSEAEIREEGRILNVNSHAVTKEVERILQMDYELFSRAVYSEQNGMDYFLRIPKGNRMQQIDRMLRVDRFEKVRERAVSISNKIETGRKEKSRIVSELEKEAIEEKINTLKKEISKLVRESEQIRKKTEETKKEREVLEKTVSSLEETEKYINNLKQEIEGLKSGIKEIETGIRKKKESLEGKDINILYKELDSIEKETKDIENELREYNERILKRRDRIASLNTEIKIITESIEEFKKLENRCPVCESEITQEKKVEILNKRESKRLELRRDINLLASEVEDMKAVKNSIEEKLRRSIAKKEKINLMIKENDFIKELEQRKSEYKKRYEELIERMKKTEEKTAEVDIEKARKELREKTAEEREYVTRLENIERTISDKNEVLSDMHSRAKMLEKYRVEIKEDERMINELNRFIKTLKLTQDMLREEFLQTVNHTMKRVWNVLYPYGDFIDIRLTVDKDYVLQLKDASGWVSVDGVVSGGERSMACMALRIAFSLAFIPNLRWLILDEPTHNLDSNAIKQFIDILREKMSSFAEQVFLITHDERISEGVEGSLYKLERNKEINEPTRVIRIAG